VRDMKNPGEKIGNDVWCDLPPEALRIVHSMASNTKEIFPSRLTRLEWASRAHVGTSLFFLGRNQSFLRKKPIAKHLSYGSPTPPGLFYAKRVRTQVCLWA
jgi:hypothetical protein